MINKFEADYAGQLKSVHEGVKVHEAVKRLVALGPYVAEVKNPKRHAATLLAAMAFDLKGESFAIQEGDTFEDYLSPAFGFVGGVNTPALKNRNAKLEMLARMDAIKDYESDLAEGKYNPYHSYGEAAAKTIHETAMARLTKVVEENPSTTVDSVMSLSAVQASGGIWGG